MSGLIKFVKTFMANGENEPNAKHADPPQHDGGDDDYSQSISSTRSPSSRTSSAISSRSVLDSQKKNISYEEWKDMRNERLMNYMEKRIVLKDDDDEEEEEETDYIVPENDELEVPFWNTQQEPSQGTSEDSIPSPAGTPNPAPHKKILAKSIPHVSETTHVTTTVSQLSMYTQDLSLSICRLEKVWGLRQIRRAEWQPTPSSTTMTTDEAARGPLVHPFQSFEDDGPLGTLYKQVLSVQVTQLGSKASSLLGRSDKPPQQLRIFFYNKYASLMSAFLDKFHTESGLLSLQHVPAKCIIPHPPQNWFDEETLVPFCVCIGDKSTMKMDTGDGSMARVYFHDPQRLVVTAAILPLEQASTTEGEVMQEIDLTPESIRQGRIQIKETSDLQQQLKVQEKYEAWDHDDDDDGGPIVVDKERASPMTSKKKSPTPRESREGEQQGEHTPLTTATATRPEVETRNVDDSETGKKRSALAKEDGDNKQPASPRTKRPKTAVVYHKLNELSKLVGDLQASGAGETHLQANIYATVLGFGSPFLTKKGDWMLSVSLVDETLPLPDVSSASSDDTVASIVLNIFCKERQSLPKLRQAGDILRLHRVQVQLWKEQVQLLGRRASSYVVSRPKDPTQDASLDVQDNWDFIPTARQEVTLEPQDVLLSSELWKWAKERLKSHPTMKFAQRFKLMDLSRQEQSEAFAEMARGDFTVLVSAVLPVPPELRNGMSPLAFLRVWDGTGPPESDFLPVSSASAAEATRKGDPSAEAVMSIADVINGWKVEPADSGFESAQDSSVHTALEPPKSLCGRVANVAIWEDAQWDLVSKVVKPGSFVRLRNVHEGKLFNGLRCLNVSSKAWLTPLPKQTFEIRVMLEEHDSRVKKKDPFNPSSGVLPLEGGMPGLAADAAMSIAASVPTRDAQPAPSLDLCIARCISEPVPSSIAVKFRITDTIPGAGEGTSGLKNLCIAGPTPGSAIFQFAVHIEDESGVIDAIVSDKVGEILLGMKADAAAQLTSSQAKMALDTLMDNEKTWQGDIHGIELNGAKFFILADPSVSQAAQQKV